jgi:mannose-6-phosphate isomerase-like protein (cupin superfamily)
MIVRQIEKQAAYTTKDGSTVREILNIGNAPVANQSLAEARLPAGISTTRHHHKLSEEIYFILSGTGLMEVDGESREVGPGDAVLIPPGEWHSISAVAGELRFLCCCAPRYTHEDTYFE